MWEAALPSHEPPRSPDLCKQPALCVVGNAVTKLLPRARKTSQPLIKPEGVMD
jgi:hypothetical protein